MSKIKKSILIGFVLSFFCITNSFARTNSNYNIQILNTYDRNEIIYLINDEGDLLKLKMGNYQDIVPNDLPKLSSIYVDENDYVALTKDGKIISSIDYGISENDKVLKISEKFILRSNGKVISPNSKVSKFLKSFENVKDIKALSDSTVILYGEDNRMSIVSDGENGISVIRNLENISEIILHENIIFIIRRDGRVVGLGDGYEKFSNIAESILNAKTFIRADENLYALTYDNNAIPIVEYGFKAPREYLKNISDIVLNKFSSNGDDFYKAYFITVDGKLNYYVQNDNEISEFNKEKIKYFKTFDNVQAVYESGYLTIVLHKDGSLTIPYNINHELNGVTGVSDVVLKNQSYVVKFNEGHVITSLDNFILNKKKDVLVKEGDFKDYIQNIFVKILNVELSEESFENIKNYIAHSKENFKNILSEIILDRKFLMIDYNRDKIIEILYDSILNTKPNADEIKHIDNVIKKNKDNEIVDKDEFLIGILNYIFENPRFDKIIDKII